MMTPAYNDQNNPQQPKTIKKSTATHHKKKQTKSTQDKIKNRMQRPKCSKYSTTTYNLPNKECTTPSLLCPLPHTHAHTQRTILTHNSPR